MAKNERDPVCEALRRLRTALGDSQQQFSRRLGLAIATVVRYEHNRRPKGAALMHLERTARTQGFDKYAIIFRRAFQEDMRSPLTDDFSAALLEALKDPRIRRAVRAAVSDGARNPDGRRLVEVAMDVAAKQLADVVEDLFEGLEIVAGVPDQLRKAVADVRAALAASAPAGGGGG